MAELRQENALLRKGVDAAQVRWGAMAIPGKLFKSVGSTFTHSSAQCPVLNFKRCGPQLSCPEVTELRTENALLRKVIEAARVRRGH